MCKMWLLSSLGSRSHQEVWAGVRLGGDRFGIVLCGPDPRFWMGRS